MFDDPLEILTLCHEKVRRFARLALKLGDHVARHGSDDAAADAAQKVLRYFNMAAPLHHDDEDLDVYPALIALNELSIDQDKKKVLVDSIHRLQKEHAELGLLWIEIKQWLEQVEQNKTITPPESLGHFADVYIRHAEREESQIYPYISLLNADTLREIGTSMAMRRGAKTTT